MLSRELGKSKIFRSRVKEAAIWCASYLRSDDPAGSLRTADLTPQLVIPERLNQFRWNYEFSDPVFAIDELCRRRATKIRAIALSHEANANGKVLIFEPHETLVDGAACVTSRGFFDDWNIPPWDTWLWFESGRFLYSWVPEAFVALAEAGISVNPEKCIYWANE